MIMNKGIIAAVVAAGVLATGSVAYVVAGPDREECKAAVNTVVLETVLHGQTYTDEQAKAQLQWPCRFQSEETVQNIGSEVMSENMGLIFAKGLEEAFK
jgi:hypothetical protein